jgi:hypothetical protein
VNAAPSEEDHYDQDAFSFQSGAILFPALEAARQKVSKATSPINFSPRARLTRQAAFTDKQA